MLSWPALLVAPLVALAQQSITYSLVTPACAQQSRGVLHAVCVVALLLVVGMTAMAWRAWQGHDAPAGGGERAVTVADGGGAAARPRFVDLIAVLVGALSALVCAALWLPVWMLSPCS